MAGKLERTNSSDLVPLLSKRCGDYSDVFSLPSQPVDIRNWFSSYEYESPNCSPFLFDLDNSLLEEDEDEVENLVASPINWSWKDSARVEEKKLDQFHIATRKRITATTNGNLLYETCEEAEPDLLKDQALSNGDEVEAKTVTKCCSVAQNKPIDEENVDRRCPPKRIHVKIKYKLPKFDEKDLSGSDEVSLANVDHGEDCLITPNDKNLINNQPYSRTSSALMARCNEELSKEDNVGEAYQIPRDNITYFCNDILESEKEQSLDNEYEVNWQSNEDKGSLISYSEDDRMENKFIGTCLRLSNMTPEENTALNGFVSTKNKQISVTGSNSSMNQKDTQAKKGLIREVTNENSTVSAMKGNLWERKSDPLTDRTNAIEHTTMISGKWKCPKRSKVDIRPPLKQLRLERWVHRVN